MADRTISPGRAPRAKLFMPFAALKGYYELILAQEAEREQRRELPEDDAAELSHKLQRLGEGRDVHICFYNGRCYETLSGTVEKIDRTLRYLIAGGRRVWFDDLLSLEEYIPSGRETWLG